MVDPPSLPWGFEFVRDKVYDPNTGALLPTVASHPTQLYEALSYFLIFGVLLIFYRKNYTKVRDGFIFGVFMIMLFSARFLIEFVKNDQVGFESGYDTQYGSVAQPAFYPGGYCHDRLDKKQPHYFNQTPIPKQSQTGETG